MPLGLDEEVPLALNRCSPGGRAGGRLFTPSGVALRAASRKTYSGHDRVRVVHRVPHGKIRPPRMAEDDPARDVNTCSDPFLALAGDPDMKQRAVFDFHHDRVHAGA